MYKLYYYPPANGKGGYGNPYSINYKASMESYYDVLEADNAPQEYRMLGQYILKRAFQADIYVFNWLENIANYRLPVLQWLFIVIALAVIRFRRKRIVWMFHNIHPHSGITFYSKTIQWLLFRFSSLIVSHSQEAAEYAQEKATCRVVYKCHPIKCFDESELKYDGRLFPCDVLIWGSILKYKGIEEFVALPEVQKSKLKIRIIGSGKDKELVSRIRRYCNDHIIFEEKRASFSEIAAYCRNAKFVLFPYIGNCVSSSGALIDTIAFGGMPVAPNIGAFKDLEKEGVCKIYKSKEEMMEILLSPKSVIDKEKFIEENGWDSFASFFYHQLQK